MRLRLAVLALIILCATAAAAAGETSQFDPETMMRTSELERGMTGYGLSVFSGVEITRFDVEILGVLSKTRLGEDMILIRVTSGPIIERASGIIGGMSGSPIYVNGKLIGAIAYGWGFLREAIGGVTPIESMMKVYASGESRAALPPDHHLRGVDLAGRRVERARVARSGPAFHDSTTINVRPVSPIISAAGMGERSMKRLEEIFEPHGLETMPGPGPLSENVPTDLEPGAAVGVKFMDGDFDITGIGTVTWRDGDSLLAFGHPMMEMGSVDFPITSAWVHDFLPSMARSSKMASPMAIMGALTRDGSWSVAGEVGAEAPMVPARFTVTDEDRGHTRRFQVDVARHEQLTSGLMMSAMMSAVEATYNVGGKGVASLEFELEGDDGAVIRRRDTIYHPGFLMPVLSWVDEALYFLTENRFDPQQPQSLRASVSLSEDENLASIERVYTDETVARAGEELTVHIVMRPVDGERFEKVVTFDLPEDLPKGSLRVGAAAGGEEYSLRAYLRLLMPQIDSLEDIAEIIETMKRSDQLYVAVGIPEITMGLEGTELPAVPRTLLRIFDADDQSDITAGYTELSETFASEYYLHGWQIARLPTENREGERGKVRERRESEEPAEAAVGGMDLQHTWWAASAIDAGARPLQEADLPEPPLSERSEEDLGKDLEEAGEEDEEENEADTREHPEPDGDALARGLSRVAHTSADDFEKGDTQGTMVRSDGSVIMAPQPELIAEVPEPGVWSIAARGETVWFGTTNPGRVYRRESDSEAEMICETSSMMVLSILPLDDGAALVGTGPDGRVLRIEADGSIAESHQLDASYVWCLERHEGTVLAGTGPSGAIFRLGEEPGLLARVNQRHVHDLMSTDGRLYAAAGDDRAAVFEVLPGGRVRSVFGTDDSSCTGLAVNERGDLVVATADDGKLFVVEPDGSHEEVYESEGDVLALASGGGRVWAATTDQGRIVVLDGQGQTGVAHEDKKTDQVIALSAGEGALFAATANPGRVWRLDLDAAGEATYVSDAIDGERVARWARMEWDANVPDGSALEVQVRSGNSDTVSDQGWSGWAKLPAESGAGIGVPAARYLQYRLRLSGSCQSGPELRRAEVLFQPRNRKPTLEVSSPKAGRALRNEFEISWDAEDDDEDTLLTELFYRPSGGEEWTEIDTVQDDDSYDWDTTEIEDGLYDLLIRVSDEPSNPTNAREEETLVERVTIDNTYPKLVVMSTPRRGDERPRLWGLVTDELSRITSIDWTFGSKERWRAAPVDDGLLDSRRELFSIELQSVPEEEYSLQVRLRDAAGNVTIETLPLLDEKPTEEPAREAEQEAQD